MVLVVYAGRAGAASSTRQTLDVALPARLAGERDRR